MTKVQRNPDVELMEMMFPPMIITDAFMRDFGKMCFAPGAINPPPPPTVLDYLKQAGRLFLLAIW